MNLDARSQRSLYRLIAMLLVLAAAILVVTFVPNPQLQVLGVGLAAAVILALEEWLKNSGDNAVPTVAAVNVALANNATSVPPPKVAVPEVAILTEPSSVTTASSEAGSGFLPPSGG